MPPERVQLAACRQVRAPTIQRFALMADRRAPVRRRRRGCGAATAMAESQRNFGRPHPLGDCRASRSLRPLLTSIPLYPWMSGAALADGKMIIWSCHTRGATLVSEAHSRGRWRRGRTHRERVGVDGDRAQPDLRERAVLVVDLASLERVERVKAVDDLSKHGVCGRREGSGYATGAETRAGAKAAGGGFGVSQVAAAGRGAHSCCRGAGASRR